LARNQLRVIMKYAMFGYTVDRLKTNYVQFPTLQHDASEISTMAEERV
jgi:hypothetical protein